MNKKMNKNKFSNNNKGFTLIELLVVIAIIGLLASIVLVNVNKARSKARDAKRKSDLHQIHLALEEFYIDNDSYINTPEICGDTSAGCSACGCPGETAYGYGNWSPTYSNLYRALVPKYIKTLPIDPLNNSWYHYYFEPNCSTQGKCTNQSWSICCEFTLCASKLETTGKPWCDDSFGVGTR